MPRVLPLVGLLCLAALVHPGCGDDEAAPPPSTVYSTTPHGTWKATLGKGDDEAALGLTLTVHDEVVEGQMRVFRGRLGNAGPGQAWTIRQGLWTDGQLTFMVPVTGRMDARALVLELKMDDGLRGTIRENSPASQPDTIVFRRTD